MAAQVVTEGIPNAQVSADASVMHGLRRNLFSWKIGDEVGGDSLCLGEENEEANRHEDTAQTGGREICQQLRGCDPASTV